ncbi:MAG: hypothetical protein O3B13_17415 [Planctomycetota bacterium]|nr:hypothetical protein [Planctomycetota bacterium]
MIRKTKRRQSETVAGNHFIQTGGRAKAWNVTEWQCHVVTVESNR